MRLMWIGWASPPILSRARGRTGRLSRQMPSLGYARQTVMGPGLPRLLVILFLSLSIFCASRLRRLMMLHIGLCVHVVSLLRQSLWIRCVGVKPSYSLLLPSRYRSYRRGYYRYRYATRHCCHRLVHHQYCYRRYCRHRYWYNHLRLAICILIFIIRVVLSYGMLSHD